MVLLQSLRTGGRLASALLAALLGGLLLVISGAPASAANVHHVREHRSVKHRGARRHATRAGRDHAPGAADGLGQLTGLLPRNHLTEESAIQVNLSNETVRLPLYK